MGAEPNPAPVPPPERLWRLPTWLLTHLGWDAYRLVVEALGSPAGRTDYAVLAGLEELGAMSQADLGRRLGIDRSDVVAVLNRLQADALVLRAQDSADRRRNLIRITPAGRRTLRRLDVAVAEAQEAVLAPLPPDERRQVVTTLQRLVEHHRGYRRPEGTR